MVREAGCEQRHGRWAEPRRSRSRVSVPPSTEGAVMRVGVTEGAVMRVRAAEDADTRVHSTDRCASRDGSMEPVATSRCVAGSGQDVAPHGQRAGGSATLPDAHGDLRVVGPRASPDVPGPAQGVPGPAQDAPGPAQGVPAPRPGRARPRPRRVRPVELIRIDDESRRCEILWPAVTPGPVHVRPSRRLGSRHRRLASSLNLRHDGRHRVSGPRQSRHCRPPRFHPLIAADKHLPYRYESIPRVETEETG